MIKQRIVDISGTVISTVKGIHVDTWIALVCVISLLIISILPVSVGRSETEIYLCFIIPLMAVIGFVIAFVRKIKIRFNWIDCIVIVWYVYAMCRLWFDATYPAAGFAIRATLMCMLYVAMRILISGCRLSGNVILFLLIFFAVVEAGMGYLQIISGTSRHHLYPVTGSFLNPGPYSAYLALGIVALCKNLTRRSQSRKYLILGYASLLFMTVPLIMTMSRAAFLAIFICLVILFHHKIKGWRQWSIFIVTASLCAVCLYFLKSGSADGRGIINYIGFHCFLDNPFLGNGIGSFFNRYALKTTEISMHMPKINLVSVDAIDYAFNDLLLVGVEQGVVGLVFVIALIGYVLHQLWVNCRPLFLIALTLLIISLFSYPFDLLPYQIIGVLITSYTVSIQKAEKADKYDSMYNAILKTTTIVTFIICILYLCEKDVRERLDAEKEYRMFAGLHDKAFIKDYYSLLNYLDDNKRFLFDFAKILSEQGHYNDSNRILRRGAQLSNDPMFLVLQGNNYRDMEAYDIAEKAYIHAYHTMPNRIYPYYRLMKLYEQLGNLDKLNTIAVKVNSFNEKIQSSATNDMKAEALEIINKYKTL
ncbi:MAG: O-antigen ligase family protein [Muribaculaceae bacterium]|nr:O-antigen ligase family protein [Muribaculaceae bacterium]